MYSYNKAFNELINHSKLFQFSPSYSLSISNTQFLYLFLFSGGLGS
jgi:hypothetical protein